MLYQYLETLKPYLSYPSISTDQKHKAQTNTCASRLAKLFRSNNFQTKIYKKYDNPIIFAEYQTNAKAETILIYGHYDVQPADKNNGWQSNPFKLKITKSKIVGRGVADNKGQSLIHILTVFDLIRQNKLKYNLKFLIEGNEETGSDGLKKFIKDHKKQLACNFILVSDGTTDLKNPYFESSFRGTFNAELRMQTAKNNLHSGAYGGTVPNAALEMSRFLSKLMNPKTNKINIPKFYKDIKQVRSQKFNKIDLKSLGVKKILTKDFYTQTGLNPSIEITGLESGYIGSGYKTIIPNQSIVKLNFRTAPNQDSKLLVASFKKFVQKNTPDYVDYSLNIEKPFQGVDLNSRNKHVKNMAKIASQVYGKKIVFRPCGGSVPIVSIFQKTLKKPIISAGLANPDCHMHGVNENFNIKYIELGFRFSKEIFSK